MNTTFGEVSWEDDVFGASDKKPQKDLWLRLDDGSNEVRLVTQPFQYLCHKYKKEGAPGFGTKINCSAVHGSCPLCEMGDKAKARWLLGVISRKTNTYKILDVSYTVFTAIRKLAKTPRWGNPQLFDLDIIVDRNAGSTGYYTVQPIPKEPLSAADQVIKDSIDLEDLKRRVTPPKPDQVQQRLDKINSDDGGQIAPKSNVKAAAKTQPKGKVQPVAIEEDEDDTFPAYDASK